MQANRALTAPPLSASRRRRATTPTFPRRLIAYCAITTAADIALLAGILVCWGLFVGCMVRAVSL